MKEQSIIEVGESRPEWETLEGYARAHIRHWLQQLLEEDVEEALGRGCQRSPRVSHRVGQGEPPEIDRESQGSLEAAAQTRCGRKLLEDGSERLRAPRLPSQPWVSLGWLNLGDPD